MCYFVRKVITFYEPLKPFMAIVIEVTVLVAAILLYENSRSKKTSSAGILASGKQIVHLCALCSSLFLRMCLLFRKRGPRPSQHNVSVEMTSDFLDLAFSDFHLVYFCVSLRTTLDNEASEYYT